MNENGWIYIGTNKIHSTAIIDDNVTLGENNIIYPYTVIGMKGCIRNGDDKVGKIIIGDNNWIGTNVSIMSGENGITKIGDNNLIMNYVNIGHDVTIGNNNEIGVGTIIAGWVKVGNKNKIKLSVIIRNRKTIGDETLIGMGAVVTKDIEDGVTSYGNPAKPIK